MTPPSLPNPADHPRFRTGLYLIAGLAAGILFVGAIVVVTQIFTISSAIRTTQVDSTQRSEDTKDAAEAAEKAAEEAARGTARIEDCTTIGGKCFEESQSRTGEAVVGIAEGTLAIIVAAISCQEDGITDQKALTRCTIKRARESTKQSAQR